MEMILVISSNIKSIGYEEEVKELRVQFKNDKIYSYPDISPEVYQNFMKAESKGKFFLQHIRPIKATLIKKEDK